MDFIDLKEQQKLIRKNIDTRISNVLNHGQYIQGPEVKELEIKKTGKVMNFSDGVYKFMSMAMNRAGRTEMVLKYGAPELDSDGTLKLVDGRDGLLEIIRKVGNQAEYFKFRATS